ncbi:hypothetical protein MUK60_42710 [Streptomyces sp. LRE541]|uniref:hypothetical protein n=1 Tax=Streptomyces sp. LRE541 TaxID=2931983 RepID=UPI00200C7630|nr:hypothetical protein [Streptomyces sp. LRE541]UPZ33919.1 hypothetical protein MUK60_42710 [Streptomyces sp. LRE541]
MPADIKVGSVSRARYDALVGEDRKLVLDETKIQFKIGDDALEIKPMRPHGGSLPATGEEQFGGGSRGCRCSPTTSASPTTRYGPTGRRPAGGRANTGLRASRSTSTAFWRSWTTGSRRSPIRSRIVHTGEGRDHDGHVYQDRHHYVWDNRSDTATLRNDNDRRIDRESWGHGGGHHRR